MSGGIADELVHQRGGRYTRACTVVAPSSSPPPSDAEKLDAATLKQLCSSLADELQKTTCYDVIGNSTQMVCLDDSLSLTVAFIAATESKVASCLLWDPAAQEYTGVITATDCIRILLYAFGKSDEEVNTVRSMPINQWKLTYKEHAKDAGPKHVVFAHMDDTVLVALKKMAAERVNRIAISPDEPGTEEARSFTAMISYPSVFQYLVQWVDEAKPDCPIFDCRMSQLNIGAYGPSSDISIQMSTPVVDALRRLMQTSMFALPIVNDAGIIVDVLSRGDALRLEVGGYYDLNVPVSTALAGRVSGAIYVYSPSDTLRSVVTLMHMGNVRTAFCVDDNDLVCGQVRMSEIMKYLLAQMYTEEAP